MSERSDTRIALAYLRVSTEDQRLGPLAQGSLIASYAHQSGILVLASFLDRVSGASPVTDRPALTECLLLAKRLRPFAVIVAKRDRLARDVVLAALIERSLPKGTTLLSADGTGNGDSPADAFLRTIVDGAAAYERALIRSRTKQALLALRQRGKRAGTVPYGYRAEVDGTLLPHDDEQATIHIVHALAEQGYSQRDIVKRLAEQGIRSRVGLPLQRSQVRGILASLPSVRAA